MASKIQSVRGMNDLLPDQSGIWQFVEGVLRETCDAYGYREIRPPLLERTELFKRSIGEQTDIVEKEMYTFVDNNGESVTLRPEATASCVRAGIEHGLLHNKPAKLWYFGPMFRHEKPQKGRYRQFYQFGIEALGWTGPDADTEILIFAARFWKNLGIKSVKLQINTLGSNKSRAAFRDALVGYLEKHVQELDEDSQRRLHRNPLRVLDSKDENTRKILQGAPMISEYLDSESSQHFELLCTGLENVGIEYEVNPLLVRGLDYYTSTVFEWVTDKLGAQSAVCAGGRYDGLVEQLGGRPTPAAGWAMGIERLIELLYLEGHPVEPNNPDAYVATLGADAELEGVRIAENLRDEGFRVLSNFGGGNFKKQLKRADQSGARFAIILGEDEIANKQVSIKDLRTDIGQSTIDISKLSEYLANA